MSPGCLLLSIESVRHTQFVEGRKTLAKTSEEIQIV